MLPGLRLPLTSAQTVNAKRKSKNKLLIKRRESYFFLPEIEIGWVKSQQTKPIVFLSKQDCVSL